MGWFSLCKYSLCMHVTLYSSNHPCFSSPACISEMDEEKEQPTQGWQASFPSLSRARVLCGPRQWHCPLWVTPQVRTGRFSNMWATISHWLWLKFRDCLHLDFILVSKKVWVESVMIFWIAFSVHFPLEIIVQAPEDPAWCWKEDLASWVKFTFSFPWALNSLRF